MKKTLRGLLAIVAAGALSLGACSNSSTGEKKESNDKATTVTIKDAHGEVTVPKNPKTVISLDNRTFETLDAWGVKLAAAPKEVMDKNSPYVKDEAVKNIGDHREPNLEVITAANPDLVIVGQRFAQHYDKIKQAAPNAAIIDINIELPKEITDANASEAGKILSEGLKNGTTTLGKIFDKEKEAEKLNSDFDKAMEAAKKAYPQGEKVLSVNTSGGKIGYLAPHVGRTLGPLYDLLGWEPAYKSAEGTANHKGDEVSVETMAQANPQWIMIMDRDAAVGNEKGEAHGVDLVKSSPAMQTVDAVKNNHIIAMPDNTYLTESIQLFTKFFNDLAKMGK